MTKYSTKVSDGRNKKRERWAKGRSSSSNPSKNKHRSAASVKRTFFTGQSLTTNSSTSKLTKENLVKHTIATNSSEGKYEEAPETETVKTFETFASDWTRCTNINFSKIISRFNGSDARHKEILAILAAVTEVIKESHGEESGTEYFAALCTSAQVTDSEESLTAICTLLSLVIKSVPRQILVSKFGLVSQLFYELLNKFNSSENSSLLRSLIGCLSVVLRSQNASNWSDSSTKQMYDALYFFIHHSKPKVRKAASRAITAILQDSFLNGSESQENGSLHPMASHTATLILSSLLQDSSGSNANTLHHLSLLSGVIFTFSSASIKKCVETVLRIMSLGHSYSISTSFDVLISLFEARPSVETLPLELNAQIITALYDYRPSFNDSQSLLSWIKAQQEAFINLSFKNPELSLSHLPKFFSLAASQGWLSEERLVIGGVSSAMKHLLLECVKPLSKDFSSKSKTISLVKQLYLGLEIGLKYQYHGAWPQVFHLLSVFIEITGAFDVYHSLIGATLISLSELRASKDFTLHSELDFVIGKGIRSLGPRVFLSFLPLGFEGSMEDDMNFPFSYLLPLLRDNIQRTSLSFFTEYCLPLSLQCSAFSSSSSVPSVQRAYETLYKQIMDLLPGFCNSPTDLKDSFKALAKILGGLLNERPELRICILSSLRSLISKAENETAEISELSRYAKNYIPILFNIYTSEPKGSQAFGIRLSALETIKVYVKIAPVELLTSLWDSAFLKYDNNSTEPFVKDSLIDILRVLSDFVDFSRLESLFKITNNKLCSKNQREQKRFYKVLESLLSSSFSGKFSFLESYIPELSSLLLSSLSSCTPPSQASRLSCLSHILNILNSEAMASSTTTVVSSRSFATSIIPEVLLCIKAVNEKARSRSYGLLLQIGDIFLTSDSENGLREYSSILFAGFGGSPTLIHVTLLSLSRIYWEFKEFFPSDLLSLLLENVILLSSSASREIVGASLSFLKVFVLGQNLEQGLTFVQKILGALLKMSEDSKRHFRLKCRYLLDRIIRKFGFDFVTSCIPPTELTMIKRLKNIRKLQERKAKINQLNREEKKVSNDIDEEFKVSGKAYNIDELLKDTDESESESENDNKFGKRKKTKSLQSVIHEDSDGILDFLDPSSSQRVTSMNIKSSKAPGSKDKNETNGDFKIASDGRILITESGDEEEMERNSYQVSKEAKKRKYMLMEDDDLNSDEDAKACTKSSSIPYNKGRHNTGSEPSYKYKAGGLGIHRPLSSEIGSEYKSNKGAFGDVKRKGKPDPFAYVPLSKESLLNKRKKAQRVGKFKGIVSAVKVGASKRGARKQGSGEAIHKKKLTYLMKNMNVKQ